MSRITTTSAAALVLVIGAAVFAVGSPQVAPKATAESVPAQELRAVRQELGQMRAALDADLLVQMQIQLAAARATTAQARVSSLTLELGNVRTELAHVIGDIARAQAEIRRIEAMVPPGTVINQTTPVGEPYAQARGQLATAQQLQRDLQLRESQLTPAIGAEQARLDAANRRLDDLERFIATRR